MKKIILVLFLCVNFGCFSSQKNKMQYFRLHADRISEEIKVGIRENKLVKGMNAEDVVFILGYHWGRFEVTSNEGYVFSVLRFRQNWKTLHLLFWEDFLIGWQEDDWTEEQLKMIVIE